MTTMTQMLGQMMWLPASLLARWMDLLVAMVREQPCCQEGEAMNRPGMAPGTGFPERGISEDNPSARGDGATKEAKEERKMSNCCCDNENGMVKLAEYTIVSIKRCEERILYKGEIVYADDMDDEAFATWVVALYLQTPDKEIPPQYLPKPSHEAKKFIRVYHNTLHEWPRQKDNCSEDREVHVLKGIEEAIRGLTRHVGGGVQEVAS
jgi:hypothetical protein